MRIARRELLLVAMALALGALALTWWLISNATKPSGSATEFSEVSSEGPYRLELSLIGGQPMSEGTPIFFDASIEFRPTSPDSSLHGEANASWAAAISPDSCRQAFPQQWWTRLRLELEEPNGLSVPVKAKSRDVGQDCTLYSRIAISPGDSLAAGTYSVRAAWELGGVEVRSEPVQVQISPASGNPVDETVHKARYQLGFETPETALRTLDESLPAAGQRAEIHSLRGQALEALGRLEGARDEYRIALDLTSDAPEDDALYEPPSLYIRQLRALDERLARQDDAP